MTPTNNTTAAVAAPRVRRPLPPKPVKRVVETAVEAPKPYSASNKLKAKEIRIILEDNTILTAKDGHAADIYFYLMDCERYCAGNIGTVSPYLGPQLIRVDKDGRPIPATMVQNP